MFGVILSNLILFDFDGVLCDSLSLVVDIANSVSIELDGNGELCSKKIGELENVTFPEIARLTAVSDEQLQEFNERLFKKLAARSIDLCLFPGVAEQVEFLSIHNTLGVITANHSSIVSSILDRAGILNKFSKIVGAEHPGTKDSKITSFANEHIRNFRNLWMVGDSKSDIKAGKLAKAHTLGVAWGWQPEQVLKEMKPSAMAHCPEELAPILTF